MSENKKKGFSALDAWIIIGAVLLVLGMIGQSVAVEFIDRKNSSEEFELSFLVRSYGSADAQILLQAQSDAGEDGLSCSYRDQEVCRVKNLHLEPQNEAESGVEGGAPYCTITGILSAKGYTEGEKYYLYGYGEIAEDDVLVLSVADRALSMEITKVNVKKIQNNT
ncbi:MAG: hypothetical protein IJZ33_08370 [Clostridia bacterium]|nr:hypothetical protein [Clostridia bacterium]